MKRALLYALALAGCTTPSSPPQLMASTGDVKFDLTGKRQSDPAEITIINWGDGETPQLRSSLAGSPSFRIIEDTCTGKTLGGGKSCTVKVVLRGDEVAGTHSGGLNVTGAPLVAVGVSLMGTVPNPELVLTADQSMVEVPAGQAPPPVKFTVENVGSGQTGEVALTASQGFKVGGTCPRWLGGGDTCSFDLVGDEIPLDAKPGPRSGVVGAYANGKQAWADVTVNVVAARSLSALGYDWGTLPYGGPTVVQTFAVHNPGPTAIEGAKVEIVDDGDGTSSAFVIDSEICSNARTEADKICVVRVRASTTQKGAFKGTLVVSERHYLAARARLTATVQ